jgi:hypothetical protein
VPPTKPTKEELREAYLKGIRDAKKGETHYASYSVKQLLQVLNAKARDTKDPRRELNIEYLKGVIHHVQSVAQKRLFMGGTLNGYIEAARATPLNHFTPKETIPPVQTETPRNAMALPPDTIKGNKAQAVQIALDAITKQVNVFNRDRLRLDVQEDRYSFVINFTDLLSGKRVSLKYRLRIDENGNYYWTTREEEIPREEALQLLTAPGLGPHEVDWDYLKREMERLGWRVATRAATHMEFTHPDGARARLYLDENWRPPQWTVALDNTVRWRGWDWFKAKDALLEAAKTSSAQTEEKPKTGLASYIQAPYEIRKVDEYGNVWYWSPWHEGLILTKNLDPAEIQKIMKDFTDVVKATQNVLRTSPYIRRYYGFNLEEIERDVNFIRPATNLVINQDPERYFGAGSSGIRQRGIKVFWFTPEKSRDYLGRSKVLMPEGTPPGAAAHEITHTLGSSKEITDPLSETVAIIFYLQHPEYLHESKISSLEYSIYLIALHYLQKTYKPGTAKEQIKAIYSAVPAKLQAILQQRFTPEQIKQILA